MAESSVHSETPSTLRSASAPFAKTVRSNLLGPFSSNFPIKTQFSFQNRLRFPLHSLYTKNVRAPITRSSGHASALINSGPDRRVLSAVKLLNHRGSLLLIRNPQSAIHIHGWV